MHIEAKVERCSTRLRGIESLLLSAILASPRTVNTATHATWRSDDGGGGDGATTPGVVATIAARFGYRRQWRFRSPTGFTALGVLPSSSAEEAGDGDGDGDDINGVLFRVPRTEMPNFDRREAGYARVPVPSDCLRLRPDVEGATPQATFRPGPADRIWLYAPLPAHAAGADENHPLLQSYVDTVLQGCLEWGGEAMAEEFILTTSGWSCWFLNDCTSSRRPWLFRKQYSTIDQLLAKHSHVTHYGDRRHPEEFALLGTASHQNMKGTWSIPRRNPEAELAELQSRFSSQDAGNSHIVMVEVSGMGGMGKSSLVTEVSSVRRNSVLPVFAIPK